MNSLERVITTLKRQEPDRVPTFEWIIDPAVVKGICGPDCSIEKFTDEMGLDAVVVSAVNKRIDIEKDRFIDEWGVERKVLQNDPLPIAVKGPLKTKADLKTYNPPDPLAPQRMDKLRQAVKQYKGKKAIVFHTRDVFSNPRDLIGFEDVLINLVDDPAFVRDLAEMSADYSISLCRRALQEGADIVFSGDDIADNRGPLFNPALFRKIFLPGFSRLVRAVKDEGGYYIKHTDGNVWPLIDDFIQAGIDCLDPIEAPAGMDIGEVKKKYGDKIAVKGNIDCRHTLTRGSKEDVADEVKNCISKASAGGGHIISSSNSIHSSVKPENYVEMLKAIKKYGNYPLHIT